MNKKQVRRKPQKYSRELKLKACQDVLSGKLTLAEANRAYDIRSSSAISRWIYQLGLKGRHKERDKTKWRRYPESFKLKVCLQISSGQMSIAQASRHFGIPSQSGIVVWLNKYGFDRDIISYKEDSISFDAMKEFAKSKHNSDESVKKRLIELEEALESALLEAEVNAEIIDIASKELEINIRKKFNTKQSKS